MQVLISFTAPRCNKAEKQQAARFRAYLNKHAFRYEEKTTLWCIYVRNAVHAREKAAEIRAKYREIAQCDYGFFGYLRIFAAADL